MNIVVITDNGSVSGGAGAIAISSAIGMAKRGHRILFFCATEPVDKRLLESPGVKVICTRQSEILSEPNRMRASIQGLWNSKARSLMRKLLDSLDLTDTVVHVHTWSKALSSSVIRESMDRLLPIVCTLHDYLIACPTGTLFHHRDQKICTLQPMSRSCVLSNCDFRNYAHKLWRVGRFAVQSSVGKIPAGIDQFVAVSELSQQVITSSVPHTPQLELISNFVEVAKVDPTPVHNNDSFLFSGRLVREKGPHLFAGCAKRLGLQAVFAGDGPLRSELTRTLPNARITGWIDHKGVLDELSRARALVFPSLWYETLGLVVLEACAVGVPCVVPDTCAARELVIDGVTGLYFRGGDVDDLEAKLRSLQDPATAARLGRAAYRRYWAAPPTLDSHLDHLENLYSRMLGGVGEQLYLHS